MQNHSYSNQLYIRANPKLVFNAITKEIDKWWTEQSNKINKVGDKLFVQFEKETSWEMDIVEYSHNFSTEWKVINANHDLEKLSRKDEWKNTTIKWKIEENEEGSKVSIIHEGLVPNLECFSICMNGWDYFLESLKKYLETGKGTPYRNI